MAEVKTMQTKKNKVYDSFVDKTARAAAADAMEKANEVESSLDEFKEEVEAVAGEMQTQIHDKVDLFVDEIAKKEQLKPEYANDISECTDTSKLYVLPDGYIYAYMTKRGELFTNQIANAIDVDGSPYNGGKGYKTGYRFPSTSPGTNFANMPAEKSNSLITGLIPYRQETVIRACGWTSTLTNDDYIYFFDENYNLLEKQQIGRIIYYVNERGMTYEDEAAFDGKAKTFTLNRENFAASEYNKDLNTAKYVAFSIQSPNAECLVVTFDEAIAFGTATKWMSTGHQFVPADCEARIIPLERSAENHESRIKTLEMYGSDSISSADIPAYIKEAADGVMDRLMAAQGNRCFTMVAMSDFHYQNYAEKYPGTVEDNMDNLVRASKAVSYILGKIHVDAVATLGDNGAFGEGTDAQMAYAHRWLKQVSEILTMTQQPGVVDFRTPGNHDRMGQNDTAIMPDNAIYRYISGYNRQCDYVDVCGGWAYRDFVGHKLRVIVLNTAECEGKARFSIHSGYHLSNKQYNWLVRTLDLSEKEDASEWQILILSHHRADDGQVRADSAPDGANAYILPNILNAYKKGGSYSGVVAEEGISVSCNFAGKNQAKLIGQIHGHHHNYKFSDLYLGLASNSTQTDIMAIGTPTTSFVAGGHNADNEGNIYKSVKDTAEETAFCVYSIDLDNHKIHAIHYGAGVDREIDY